MFAGICPKCSAKVSIKYKGGTASEHFGMGKLQIVTYTCSACESILGVQTDPLALMADQTEQIAKRLGAKDRGW